MDMIERFFSDYWKPILLSLLLVAAISLSIDIQRPLVDYDEATYAHVITDTLHSGNVATFTLGGQNWFEKPPLYLWIAMILVKVLGAAEYVFRIPGILAALLCYVLVYLILRYQTKSDLVASVGFLILLFSNTFFIFSREARLDSAVTMTILAALYFWFKGLVNEKYLLWIAPAIAVGILFKSVIGLLALPILFIYSLCHKEWRWLRSKYLWFGSLPALAILMPWHLFETARFGHVFWDSYLGRQVLQRATSTITGTDNYYDYLSVLWSLVPWIWVWIGEGLLITGLIIAKKYRNVVAPLAMLAPILSVLFLTCIFTLQKTHLGTYLIPAFPLIAISMTLVLYALTEQSRELKNVMFGIFAISIVVGAVACFNNLASKVPPFTYEEMAIGKKYSSGTPGPLYVLDWNVRETVNFYGDTMAIGLSPEDGGRMLTAPFYMFVTLPAETYFFAAADKPRYEGLSIQYQSNNFALIFGQKDLQLPSFKCCSH